MGFRGTPARLMQPWPLVVVLCARLPASRSRPCLCARHFPSISSADRGYTTEGTVVSPRACSNCRKRISASSRRRFRSACSAWRRAPWKRDRQRSLQNFLVRRRRGCNSWRQNRHGVGPSMPPATRDNGSCGHFFLVLDSMSLTFPIPPQNAAALSCSPFNNQPK